MTEKVVKLPDGFIGKDDEARLESFGAHLISHGIATRWHWRRRRGIDVAFEIYCGGMEGELLASISRDRRNDVFTVKDGYGRLVDAGTLERIMTTIDAHARRGNWDPPA